MTVYPLIADRFCPAKTKEFRVAYGALFVEVRVHCRTCEVRVPRMVGAFASGTIVNPMAAHSQSISGMIWGMSSALHEKTEIDLRQRAS